MPRKKMRGEVILLCLWLCTGLVAGDWNILSYITSKREDDRNSNVEFSLRNYCESWRMNAELNNIRGFEVVPGECVGYIGAYMTSTQYEVDVQLAAEESLLFLTDSFQPSGDGKDAWIFDLDDVLLSTVPYFKMHDFGYTSYIGLGSSSLPYIPFCCTSGMLVLWNDCVGMDAEEPRQTEGASRHG